MSMAISPGAHIGRYEVKNQIGAGGMGEVYRARDPRIGRDVAIKVLPATFSADTERLRRFEQEAQAAGALNHPNILAIYDVESYAGSPYVVSELLEGETLREQLEGAVLPTRKAIDYALQFAQGMAAAHERGIVHRDLKPENLFITKDGRVKILDFGLAKLKPSNFGVGVDTEAQTQRPLTDPGVVMGTVGYMSPEQVRGHHTDHRSDIFSFGVVLYEMLSGRRAFTGDSIVELLNAILKEEPPDLSETNAKVSPTLEKIMRRCLEKRPERRFHSAHDLAFALEALSTPSGSQATASLLPVVGESVAASRHLLKRERLIWLAAIILLAALTFAVGYFRHPPAEAAVLRFPVSLPEKVAFFADVETHNLSVSPDGRRLAFVATSEGQRALWVRSLDALAAQALPGTEGAYSPFWSPDGRYIAFFAGGKLRRIEPSGASPQTICDLSGEIDSTGTWGLGGVILYTDRANNVPRIYRVSAAGGAPTPVAMTGQFAPQWVHLLSDARHFLVYGYAQTLVERREPDPAKAGIYVASLDSAEPILLLPTTPSRVEYAQGYLLYAREGSLLAQPFDEKNLRLSGEPLTVVERFPYFDKTGWSEFSVSENGVLAYMTEFPLSRLVWLDRSGRETGQIGSAGIYGGVRLSPDGQRLGLDISDPRTDSGDVWIHDLARDTPTRFAFGPSDDASPIWSPDGRRLAYFSCCDGKSTLYIKGVNDSGKGEMPLEAGFYSPLDWSPDGRFILFSSNPPTTKRDLWVLPLDGDRKPFPFLQTPFSETVARFSPDGHWVAFVSNETGRDEIYVTRFGQPGEKWRISTSGGTSPCWRRDGKELFFLAPDRHLMTVSVKAGDTFQASAPVPLFRNDSVVNDAFDVTADGQRFVFNVSATQTQTIPFTVVIHWTGDLKP